MGQKIEKFWQTLSQCSISASNHVGDCFKFCGLLRNGYCANVWNLAGSADIFVEFRSKILSKFRVGRCWREVNSSFDLIQLIHKIVRPWFLYQRDLQSSLANQLNWAKNMSWNFRLLLWFSYSVVIKWQTLPNQFLWRLSSVVVVTWL